ncbi:MAG TPA: alpha/beta fold hydrolase [Allosphingosinicella sp.]|nr:alpha/beta fold hydrolase [Allosphingosinicella sp.]
MSGAGGLAFDRYTVDGCSEWMMRIGRAEAPPIVIVPALFEEMNRTRALVTAMMRALAADGFGCWLPDLPGTGESERALEEVSWDDWRTAVSEAADHAAAASGRSPVVAALRGGCLIDDAAEGAAHWRLAPALGASLARDMERSGMAGVAWAGYAPSPSLRAELEAAVPEQEARLRTVRLASDRNEADAKIAGPALWRRSEPGTSAALAAAAAADLSGWAKTCAAS